MNKIVEVRNVLYKTITESFVVFYILFSVLPLCKEDFCELFLEYPRSLIEGSITQAFELNRSLTSTSFSISNSTSNPVGSATITTIQQF